MSNLNATNVTIVSGSALVGAIVGWITTYTGLVSVLPATLVGALIGAIVGIVLVRRYPGAPKGTVPLSTSQPAPATKVAAQPEPASVPTEMAPVNGGQQFDSPQPRTAQRGDGGTVIDES